MTKMDIDGIYRVDSCTVRASIVCTTCHSQVVLLRKQCLRVTDNSKCALLAAVIAAIIVHSGNQNLTMLLPKQHTP